MKRLRASSNIKIDDITRQSTLFDELDVQHEQVFNVYHAGSSAFQGWNESKIRDLGLHCSYDKPRLGRSYVAEIQIRRNAKLATVKDANNWTTGDGFCSILNDLGSRLDKHEQMDMYRNIRGYLPSQGPEISKVIRDYLIKQFQIQGLRYRDIEDGYEDDCICIIDPSIIVSFENMKRQVQ